MLMVAQIITRIREHKEERDVERELKDNLFREKQKRVLDFVVLSGPVDDPEDKI